MGSQKEYARLETLDLLIESRTMILQWVHFHTWLLKCLKNKNTQTKLIFGHWESLHMNLFSEVCILWGKISGIFKKISSKNHLPSHNLKGI